MMRHTVLAALALSLVACAAGTASARPGGEKAPAPDDRNAVLQAMTQELERNATQLTLGDHEPPYFLAYTVRDDTQFDIQGRYGAVIKDTYDHGRNLFVEARVGSYQLDNSKAVGGDGLFGPVGQGTWIGRKDAPIDGDLDALKAALWLATDEKYKAALSNYLKMRGDRVYEADEEEAPAFAKAEPVKAIGPERTLTFDRDGWRAEVRRASAQFNAVDHIFDNLIRVTAGKERRWLVNSEGTRLVTDDVLYGLHLSAVSRAEDGMLLSHERSFYGRTEDELPRGEALDAEVKRLVSELSALRDAPVMDPYTGPAILAPEATGVLFHEAIGHRLEGERQDDDESGRTFKGQVGRRIIPKFLTVYDDPTLATWEKEQLNGHYAYDDEGVPAQRASLISSGVLEGYLKSRTPVKDAPPVSNGHGRSQGLADPIARMGNLVVVADPASDRVVDWETLKQRLVEEAKRQGKPYGLIIKDISGGDTNTSSYGYQAFRGTPTLAYRVDVETGKEELVRGIEIVGTPLTVINKITAASRETDVFNGFCGAESGFVPVSTVAPATLITEVELQRRRKDAERPPVLPPPWTIRQHASAE